MTYRQFVATLAARKIQFRIVFRTFGTDLPRLTEEFNDFCSGRNPLHPDLRLDGTNGSRDLRIQAPPGLYYLIRTDTTVDGLHLIQGWTGPDCNGNPPNDLAWARQQADLRVLDGRDAVEFLRTLSSGSNTLGVRDDYVWWNSHGRTAAAGKTMVMDETASHIKRVGLRGAE